MDSVWILGYGPLLVDSQFVVDYKRLNMAFNGTDMPNDYREGIRLLYDTLGAKYFTYTKYMNQTLGNHGYHVLKTITTDHVIVDMPTIRVNACSVRSEITFSFFCNILNEDLISICAYYVTVKMSMETYNITVDCTEGI